MTNSSTQCVTVVQSRCTKRLHSLWQLCRQHLLVCQVSNLCQRKNAAENGIEYWVFPSLNSGIVITFSGSILHLGQTMLTKKKSHAMSSADLLNWLKTHHKLMIRVWRPRKAMTANINCPTTHTAIKASQRTSAHPSSSQTRAEITNAITRTHLR